MFTLKLQDQSPVCELSDTTIVVFSDKDAKDGETHLAHNIGELRAGANINWPGEYDRGGTAIRGLSAVDVLVLESDNAKKAEKTVEALDPRIVVIVENGESNAELLKALTNTIPEPVQNYTVKSSMPAEGREIVILSN